MQTILQGVWTDPSAHNIFLPPALSLPSQNLILSPNISPSNLSTAGSSRQGLCEWCPSRRGISSQWQCPKPFEFKQQKTLHIKDLEGWYLFLWFVLKERFHASHRHQFRDNHVVTNAVKRDHVYMFYFTRSVSIFQKQTSLHWPLEEWPPNLPYWIIFSLDSSITIYCRWVVIIRPDDRNK